MWAVTMILSLLPLFFLSYCSLQFILPHYSSFYRHHFLGLIGVKLGSYHFLPERAWRITCFRSRVWELPGRSSDRETNGIDTP